jgi:hypothetical protein
VTAPSCGPVNAYVAVVVTSVSLPSSPTETTCTAAVGGAAARSTSIAIDAGSMRSSCVASIGIVQPIPTELPTMIVMSNAVRMPL